MQHSDAISRSNQENVVPVSLIISPMLASALGLLVIVLIGGGLFFAPDLATFAVVGIGVGLPLLWFIWARPEFGLLGLVFLTSNFVAPDLVDIRVLGGGLDLRDLTLIFMIGAPAIYKAIHKDLAIPCWPVSGMLLVFIVVATFSALYGLLYHNVEPNWVFSEFRPTLYYTICFAVVWGITRPKQLVVLLAGLFLLADLTSTIIVLQQFFGKNNALLSAMGNSSWYVRETDEAGAFGTLRIVPPGHVLTFVMSIVAFSLMLSRRHVRGLRLFFVCQFLYLNFGLLFTYTRSQWVASVIAILVLTIVLPAADKRALTLFLLVVGSLGISFYSLFGTEVDRQLNESTFVTTVSERMFSLFTPEETLETDSLEWRVQETQAALQATQQHPVIGVGLGNMYREPFLLQGEAQGLLRRTRFVHNSYLYIAVKMGLIGLGAFALLALTFLAHGWQSCRRMAHKGYMRLAFALLASFFGFLFWAGSQMHVFQVESTIVIGLLIGLVPAILQLDQRNSLPTAGGTA
jgi:O-antigen ligase